MRTVLLAALLWGLSSVTSADDVGIFAAADIQWQEAPKSLPPGATVAVLEGDPNKDGFFLMCVKMPDGYKVPLHTHGKTERVTVLAGTMNLMMGDHPSAKDAKKMTVGAFGFWPAGMKHAAWMEGETILQVHGIGPWDITYVDPKDDPRNTK